LALVAISFAIVASWLKQMMAAYMSLFSYFLPGH